MEEKSKLRNQLFEMYFEENDGVVVSDLVENLSFVTDTWEQLHNLLEENVEYFDSYSSVDKVTQLYHNGTKYLVIKINMWNYIIVNMQTQKVLNKNDIKLGFKEEFFIDNFSEEKIKNDNYINMYHFSDYEGDLSELISFYMKNEKLLKLPHKIYYRLNIDDAFTSFSINLINGKSQLCFQTPDQFLYEHLFLDKNLFPSRMQDAQSRIGVEKMKEMFERIPDIKIPVSIIPIELYQILLDRDHQLLDNDIPKQLKKKK